MDRESFFLEIGVEELPAIPFLSELPNIEKKFKNILLEYKLSANFEFFYTPRRLIFYFEEFPLFQESSEIEFFGPPIEIAFKDGEPTKVALGFFKKIGTELQISDTRIKNNKEVLYYKRVVEGKRVEEVLEEILDKFLDSLNFGKSMRWGEIDREFIRPIRWIVALLGAKSLDISLFGVCSKPHTFGHRAYSFEPLILECASSFREVLESGYVIYSQEERERIVLDEIREIQRRESIDIEIDRELLKEIVAITEYPTPLLGDFDEAFLELPPEVIITSMREHQRYFSCFRDGKLTNRFIVVSNSIGSDSKKIIDGNKKVLQARLSDGLFFYKNDLKNGLCSDGLSHITYLEELGTMAQKRDREIEIGLHLFSLYEDRVVKELNMDKRGAKELLKRAIYLAKADLLSEMVYEFTELQGVIGYYYALAQNESKSVAVALKEQYLPNSESSPMPSSIFSSIVSISIKLDSLLSLFSIGKIPSGTKDPYALRRAALGILRVSMEYELDFDLRELLLVFSKNYKEFDIEKLNDFILERIYTLFKDVNPSLIKSIILANSKDILSIKHRILALDEILQKESAKEIFSTFKRVANISKDIDFQKDLNINSELFENEYESNLYAKFIELENMKFETIRLKIESYFLLKDSLDLFFDNVLVNCEDEPLRENRKNLIGSIYRVFKEFADLKEITI